MNKYSKNLFVASGLALAMMTLGEPVLSETLEQNMTDVRQEAQIWTTYTLNPYLRMSGLKASVKDGKATLTGSVPEGVDKALAKAIALGVEGIKEVDNQITVDGDELASHATAMQNYGEVVDDVTTTLAVTSKLLWSKYTSALNTQVDTKAGRVTLTGTADSGAAKELAGRLAANTRGVVSVSNRLVVSPPKVVAMQVSGARAGSMDSAKPVPAVMNAEQAVSDSWITTKVKSTLLYSSNVVGSDIAVTTKMGVVSLDGKVSSGAERSLAIELAKNVRGVKAVNSTALKF
ncbi:osmotically-inducible protein OsmY [Jezberella montanilacus]|jgi:osmotically-inducible protein OsmY|uniref:Osmotically-inducible protein OsmY n=1 Tax=Jezberella montanilacus TaxID=323426 RepID=A0A2T0XBM8_9BURK|nr:BON domain-containing protein [Jezberella montanilacus]PRY96331.1 osmotically-inducible protein OsmY [Jezberella montanilacus]